MTHTDLFLLTKLASHNIPDSVLLKCVALSGGRFGGRSQKTTHAYTFWCVLYVINMVKYLICHTFRLSIILLCSLSKSVTICPLISTCYKQFLPISPWTTNPKVAGSTPAGRTFKSLEIKEWSNA